MDDTLIHGSNQQEHDECLIAVLEQLKKFLVTLNKEKVCVFNMFREVLESRPRESTGNTSHGRP